MAKWRLSASRLAVWNAAKVDDVGAEGSTALAAPTRAGKVTGHTLRRAARTLILPGSATAGIEPLSVAHHDMPAAADILVSREKLGTAAVHEAQTGYHRLTARLFGRKAGSAAQGPPAAERAVADREAFVRTATALFDPQFEMEATTLARALADSDSLAAPGATTPWSKALQVARALAAVSEAKPTRARLAFDAMRRPFTIGASPIDENRSPRDIERAAAAERLLSLTATGRQALMALHADASLAGDEPAPAMKREALVTFLQTSQAVIANAPPGIDLSSSEKLLAHARRRVESPTLAPTHPEAMTLHALLAAKAVFDDPLAVPVDARQVGAFFAWRMGLVESGPHSTLASIQDALWAMPGKWIGRGEARAERPHLAFDPRRVLGKRKTPIAAMGFGAGGVNLGKLHEEAAQTRDAVRACLDHLARRCRADPATAALPEVATLAGVVDFWKARLAEQDHAARTTFHTKLQKPRPHAAAPVADRIDDYALRSPGHQAFKHLTLDAIAEWSRALDEAGVPASGEPGELDALLLTARHFENSRPLMPQGTSRADVQAAIDQILQSPVGNNVRYYDGGWFGLNLHAAINFAGLMIDKLHIGVSVVPLLKILLGRFAMTEYGSTSLGGEIVLSREGRVSTAVGVSGFGGVKFETGPVQNKTGVGFGAAYLFDKSRPEAAIVRARVKKDEKGNPTESWRAALGKVIEHLFEQSTRAADMSPEQLWNGFARKFFHERDISVNWRGSDRASHTIALEGFAGLRMAVQQGVEAAYVGPAVTVDLNIVPHAHNHRLDANGALRGRELAEGHATAGALNASVLVSAPAVGDPASQEHGAATSATLPGVPVIGMSFPFLNRGGVAILRVVEEDGLVSAAMTRTLIEFASPKKFVEYVNAIRPEICPGGPDKNHGDAVLDRFIADVERAALRGNQYFGESRKMHPSAIDRINAYRDDMSLLRATRKSGTDDDEAEIARLDQAIADILDDPASSFRAAFYTYEMNSKGYDRGIPLGIQMTAATSSLGERQLMQLLMSDLKPGS